MAAAAIAGAATFLLTRDEGSKNPAETAVPSFASGREATLAVYEAWLSDELETLDADQITANARDALSRMPTAPVAPSAPTLDFCNGSPDDVSCTYDYPEPIPFHLRVRVLFEATGPRVVEVGCFDANGDLVPGGIPACARVIRDS